MRNSCLAFLSRLSISLLFIIGCGEQKDFLMQPNKPNSNNSITRQTILGDEENRSWIEIVEIDDTDNIYFYGPINRTRKIYCSDLNGNMKWQYDTEAMIKEMHICESPFTDTGNILVSVGGTYEDGESTNGVVIVVDTDGTEITALAIENDNYPLWINDVTRISLEPSDCTLMTVGHAVVDGTTHPYMMSCKITSDTVIVVEQDKVFMGNPNIFFEKITCDPVSNSNYFVLAKMDTSIVKNDHIMSIDETLDIMWDKEIQPLERSHTHLFQIRCINNSIYTVGATGADKRIGEVISLTESGDINWRNNVILSEYSEAYYDCIVHDNALYAVGVYSGYIYKTTTHVFAYALLSKFELDTGQLIFHKSVGDKHCSSGFRAVRVKDDRAICGGWTSYYINHYWVRGWLLEIDIISTESEYIELNEN